MRKIVLRVAVVVDDGIDDKQVVEFLEEEMFDAINISWYEVEIVDVEEEGFDGMG